MSQHAAFTRRHLVGLAMSLSIGLSPPAHAFAQKKIKIGIIGAGRIGGALAKLWAEAGYPVMVSARNAEEVRKLAAKIGHSLAAGTPREAASYGDVVVISVPYAALSQIGRDFASELKGKVVLDTCNPKGAVYLGLTRQALALGTGIMDQRYLPGTRLVKAFNTVNSSVLESAAHRSGEQAGVPLAADDKQALAVAIQLVKDAGYEPVVAGGLASAKIFDSYTPFHTKGMSASMVRKLLIEKPAPIFTN